MEAFRDILSKCLPCSSARLLHSPTSTSSIFRRNHRVSPEENDTIVVDGRNIAIRTTDSKGRRLSNEILNGEINLHYVNDSQEEDDENQVIIECPTVSNFPLESIASGNASSSSPSRTRSPDHELDSFESKRKRKQSVVDERASYNNNSHVTTVFIETEKRKHLRVVHLSPIENAEVEDDDDDDDDEDDDDCQDKVDGIKRKFGKGRNGTATGNNICGNNSSGSDDEDEYWFSKWARRPRLKKYLEEKKNAENKEASVDSSGPAENNLPEFQIRVGSEQEKTPATATPQNGILTSKNNLERRSISSNNSPFSDSPSQGVRFSKNQYNDDDHNLYAKNNVSLTLPLPSAPDSISYEDDKENVENENPNENQSENEKDLNNIPPSTIKANFNLSHGTENGFTNYAFQPDIDQIDSYYKEDSLLKLDNENEKSTSNDFETGVAEHTNSKLHFNHNHEDIKNYRKAYELKNQEETIKNSEESHAQNDLFAVSRLESSNSVVSTFNETFTADNRHQLENGNAGVNDDLTVDVDQVCLNLNDNIPLTPLPSPTPSVVEKPLLFFIHGISGSSETWKGQMDYFHSLGYEIVSMDLLGHGMSGTPSPAKLYHFESLVHDVITVFDHFVQDEQRQAVVIGHGYGACLATVLTRVRPKNTCILVSISGGGPTPMVSSYWCDSAWFPFPCSLLPRTKKRGRFDNPDLKNILPRNVHENILHGQIWLDGDPAFHRRITVPTLLIYGMRDKVVNLVEVCEMERTIPRAFLELIPTAGHMVMWDEPDKLNRMIRKFIQAQWS